ncbi:MAG: TonB-dependent receptor, partial [Treponema sp.]|nr:TonB-dependent receptor [Treponema sp.]
MNSVVLLLIFFIPFFVFSQENPDEYEESFEEIFIEDDGITVVGTLQTSQQMAVIDRKEIEMRNAADLAALLQEALNVNIVRYGPFGNQAGVNLRGFDSKRLAFLVDGVPVNSSIDGKFDLNQIDLHSVERIEIIYGGSDSKYNISGALGGIVNIVTVKKQNPGLKFNAAISNTSVMPGEYRDRNGKTQPPRWEDLLDTQNYSAAAAYGSKAFSFTVAANANRAANHFVFKDFLHNTRRKDNNEFWNTGFSSSLVWELPELQKIIASSNVYYGSGNFPASGFSAIYGTQNDLSLSQKLMLDAPRAFHDSLSCEASIAWLYNRRDYYSPNSALSRHNQNSLNAVNRWSWFPAEPFVVRSGLDYRLIFLDSTEIGSRIRHDGGFYLTLEYKAANAFIIVPSVKTVFTGTGEKTVTAVPKLGLAWNVTEKIALKNNYFRIFKFPDFEELYWS